MHIEKTEVATSLMPAYSFKMCQESISELPTVLAWFPGIAPICGLLLNLNERECCFSVRQEASAGLFFGVLIQNLKVGAQGRMMIQPTSGLDTFVLQGQVTNLIKNQNDIKVLIAR